jgi:VWFA-related protein
VVGAPQTTPPQTSASPENNNGSPSKTPTNELPPVFDEDEQPDKIKDAPADTGSAGADRQVPVLKGGNTTSNSGTPSATPVNSDQTVAASDDDEVIRIETTMVTLPVSVIDRDGRFVAGLRQQDFEIYEDGKLQKIDYFAATESPFTVALLIDVSRSTSFRIEEIQDAAISFINNLRRDDRIMIIAFDDNIRVLTEATNDRKRLQNAIRTLRFGDGTKLYDAVNFTLRQKLGQIEGRKAIVLLTDGVDSTSRQVGSSSTVSLAEEADSLIYPVRFDTYEEMKRQDRNSGGGIKIGPFKIPIGSGQTDREQYARGERYLQDLAIRSGGRYFNADTTRNLTAAFEGIAEELRRQYSLGYYPETEGKKGERRQIKVKIVGRSYATARTKNSYTVGENTASTGNTNRQLGSRQ